MHASNRMHPGHSKGVAPVAGLTRQRICERQPRDVDRRHCSTYHNTGNLESQTAIYRPAHSRHGAQDAPARAGRGGRPDAVTGRGRAPSPPRRGGSKIREDRRQRQRFYLTLEEGAPWIPFSPYSPRSRNLSHMSRQKQVPSPSPR